MQKKVILAVDPGLNGGLCFMTEERNILLLQKMPTIKTASSKKKNGKTQYKRQVDIKRFADLISTFEPDIVYIEKVGARPGQGVTSMFTFGVGYGMILGLCLALGEVIKTVLVIPQVWQKELTKQEIGESPKDRALLAFEKLFPEQNTIHDGCVDAALIAEYGRMQLIKPQNQEHVLPTFAHQ
jgi:crossover junction endodeoxyribonuclease RuvC